MSRARVSVAFVVVISVGKARECKLESDCAGIQNTTCMADPRDGRTRCLCGDFSPPLNGACTNKFKGNQLLLNIFSLLYLKRSNSFVLQFVTYEIFVLFVLQFVTYEIREFNFGIKETKFLRVRYRCLMARGPINLIPSKHFFLLYSRLSNIVQCFNLYVIREFNIVYETRKSYSYNNCCKHRIL